MSWVSRFRNALHPGRLDEDLAAEMRDHLERRIESLIESGLTPEAARRQAEAHFGNQTRLREESRDVRLWPALESSIQDARRALRGMRKTPVLTATVVLSLGLAIGANTAIFSIVDAAILRPLPVHEPERLFSLATPAIGEPEPSDSDSFSYPMYARFRVAASGSARLALVSFPGIAEVRAGDDETSLDEVTRAYVSGDAFEILGVPPAIGRVFSGEDDNPPGGHPVVVLSYDYWQRRFQGDPGVVGRTLTMDGRRFYRYWSQSTRFLRR